MPRDPQLADLESHLRRRLASPLPGASAHWRFAPDPSPRGWNPDLQPETARHAATLVLIYPGAAGPSIPLTVRRADLAHHAAQVSLPGGAVDPGETPASAALREAHEEVGVPDHVVRLIGHLSPVWIAVSNFLVHPFIGVADDRPQFTLHPGEVERLIEIPVADLRDPSRLRWTEGIRGGVSVEFPYFDVAGHVVWGATAMILGELACLFDESHAPPPRERKRKT